jgi:uncharacterized protein
MSAIDWVSLSATLAAGFLGSAHCMGMCGVVMSAGQPTKSKVEIQGTRITPIARRLSSLLSFNAGRIASYALAGAMLGSLGNALVSQTIFASTMSLRTSLFVLGQVFVIAMALYVIGNTRMVMALEALGSRAWRWIQPYAARQLATNTMSLGNARTQFTLGLLWGWIPCGLVYAMLALALASQSALSGALTMIAFGLGTLPAMLLVGVTVARVREVLRNKVVRGTIASVFIAIAGLNLMHVAGFSKLSAYATLCKIAGFAP